MIRRERILKGCVLHDEPAESICSDKQEEAVASLMEGTALANTAYLIVLLAELAHLRLEVSG